MRINHVAIWCRDLEAMRDFYASRFNARPSERYGNPKTGFSSYFMAFESGPSLELMHMPGIAEPSGGDSTRHAGLAHLAVGLPSRSAVDRLTEEFRQAGYTVAGEPRVTGDGCYESVILDPEGNRVELVQENDPA